MQFALTETQQTLKNTVRKFLAAECPMAEVRKLMETDTALDAALWGKIAEQGWNGMILPEEFGGFGMGMVEMAATLEEMGRALLPGPFFSTVLMAGPLLQTVSMGPEQRKYLSAISSGEAKAAVALLEESASWSPDSVQLKAASSSFERRTRALPYPS
jgi:alkylation response protein AidB-like acyl-CoA dehydrogenase